MIRPWLRFALVCPLLVAPALARAGGGGSSSSGGESSGTDSGGTDTGSDTGTDSGSDTGMSSDTGMGSDTGTTGEGSSSDGGICGECTPLDEMVRIVSPMDGEVVAPSLDVRITAPHTCVCETMCCNTNDPYSVSLRVDGMTVESCSQADRECNTRDQTFSIVLEPGTHVLDAAADVDFSAQFSAPVEVTVPGVPGDDSTGAPPPPPPPPPPPAGSSGDSSGSETGAADGEGGGCGCRSTGSGGPAGLLVLVVLGALRRRPARSHAA